jgi:hypothetical protein
MRDESETDSSIWTWIAISALVIGAYTYFVLDF